MDFRQVSPNTINYLKSASIAVQAKLYIKISKLHRVACQNVWFNQQCKYYKVIPNYINIRTNSHSQPANIALQKAQRIWLNEEARRWFTIRDNLKLNLKILHSELSFKLHCIEFDLLDHKARDLAARAGHDKYVIQNKKLQNLINQNNNLYNLKNKHHYSSRNYLDQFSSNHCFYPRVKNLSDIQFTNDETKLLEKGLKYSLHKQINQYSIESLAIDAEVGIIRNKKDNIIKSLVADKIQTFKDQKVNNYSKFECKLYNSIRNKIEINNLVINKADKGNTTVILPRADYNSKVNDVILTDEFQRLPSDPTNHFQAQLKLCIKNCEYLFPTNSYISKTLVPMNPQCPLLYGLPKLHKENIPIRPVVSYVNAPTYKLAKYLNKVIKDQTNFNPKYSIKNYSELIDKIKDVVLPQNAKLVSLDVESLFTNVPYRDCLGIIKNMLERRKIHPKQAENILSLTELCMKQNYFQFNNEFYLQKEGLAMGSPLSPLMANIFMDNFEQNYIIKESQLLYYYRYVDDILLVWTGTIRQLHNFVNKLNKYHSKIKFKIEVEQNNCINFLDLSIFRENNKHRFEIYRKPSYTDTIIPASSCHPWQHKLAAFHSMIHRLFKVPLCKESFTKEMNIIHQIAVSNGFDKNVIVKLIKRKQFTFVKRLLYPSVNEPRNFTCTLSYFGNITEKLAKLLNSKGIYSAFKPKNSLKTLCNGKDKANQGKQSGVYKLTCDVCKKVYIGQTGRNFNIRYKEHLAACRNNKPEKSHFAKHLLESNHSLNNNNTFKILHKCNKNIRLDLLEQLEIVKCNKNTLLNEQTDFQNTPLIKMFAFNSNSTPHPPP